MDIAAAHRDNLLAIATVYAEATGLSLSSVSRKFHGNQAFLRDYKAGKCTVTSDKLAEMVTAFRAAWPRDTDWPVTRPIWM